MISKAFKSYWFPVLLIVPFLAIYGLIFIYPTISMFVLSFTDAPLIGSGDFVGLSNYARLFHDPRLLVALWNTAYFVILSVIPGVAVALLIALAVQRLSGRLQAAVLALFFLPFILPVSVVYLIWDWILNYQFGIGMHLLDVLGIPRVPVFKTITWFMPATAFVTIWWTCGFSLLVFLAGLRAIPGELYEAAALDNAGRWTTFRRITWPLLWPVTALVLTIQLILQLKIFDQVYLFSRGGRPNDTMVMVQYIYTMAFENDHGGRAAAIAVTLFLIVIVVTLVEFQLLRLGGGARNK
ncbi:MAG: sugar ABC transporter permease [Pseudomonadota bacterium]|nr:sugar ABC transporter permease [Pseudomonadota bacterium]